MVITAEQRAARRHHIGGSDVSAICGVNPWKSAHDVWLEKTGRLPFEEQQGANHAADLGNALEPGLIAWARPHICGPAGHMVIKADDTELPVDGSKIIDHVDALTHQGDPVECKTTGLVGPISGEWGRDWWSDVVPAYVRVQSHVHMLATKRGLCYVVALIGGRGPCIYEITRHASIENSILESCEWFWTHCVNADNPPADMPALANIRRITRRNNPNQTIPTSIVRDWLDAKEQAKTARAKVEQSELKVLMALGDSIDADCEIGTVTMARPVGIDRGLLQSDSQPRLLFEPKRT